jgi:hypothetical protein
MFFVRTLYIIFAKLSLFSTRKGRKKGLHLPLYCGEGPGERFETNMNYSS